MPFPLAICTLFRNEAQDLGEWIEFHRARGVEHFYLYDHESDDDATAILAPYVEAGIVTLTRWTIALEDNAQTRAFLDCIARHADEARWIAFVDVDEFLFDARDPDGPLPRALEAYRAHPGVVVHWQCYGSGGHATRPTGRVLDDFVHRAPTRWFRNAKVKSIVDPTRAKHVKGPHFFVYDDDALAVDERFRSVDPRRLPDWLRAFGRRVLLRFPGLGAARALPLDPFSTWSKPRRTISAERLRINHYVVKSRHDFAAKAARGGQTKYDDAFFRMHDRNEVHDPVLAGRGSFER